MNMSDMRAWVGCLACYNGGVLRGRWVDAIEADELTTEELHGGPTSHEELWCLDVEDATGAIDGEMSPSAAAGIARAMGELDEDEREPFVLWARSEGYGLTDADRERFRDAYCGQYRDGADYAQELAEELIPGLADASWPTSCIDWDHAWRELRMDGYWEENGYIFRAI